MAGPDRTPVSPSVPNWDEVEARLRAAWNACRARDTFGEQVTADSVRQLLRAAVGFLPGCG